MNSLGTITTGATIRRTFRLCVLGLGLGWGSLQPVYAQSGGYSFEFLNMTNPARQAALGAEFLSVRDADIQLALANPSLITSEIHNNFAVNYVNYFSGINYGFASYARHFDKVGNFAFHVQFANYGKIESTNEFGAVTGEATANDAAIILGWGRSLDTHFTIGANLKIIGSFIDRYSAVGMAVDVAATYTNTSRLFAVSLLLRNMGGALKTYNGDGGNRMPFEVAVALSQKIPRAPFRILLEFPNLQKWNLNYDDPFGAVDLVTGERKKRSKAGDFFDDLGRHIVVGLEVIPYKGFYLRAAYNYDRGQNMSTTGKPGMVGFSWGFGFRVYKFNFSYARSAYHLVGSPNYISLAIDIDAIQKKGFKNMKWNE